MDTPKLLALIERLRRATRNSDVLDLCDTADRMRRELEKRIGYVTNVTKSVTKAAKRDRAKYMRDYRATKRQGAGKLPVG
jgi:hypothetical protein